MVSAPFISTLRLIIAVSTRQLGHILRLYFPSLVMRFQGKMQKQGVDRRFESQAG
jgi:hypothetical protein